VTKHVDRVARVRYGLSALFLVGISLVPLITELRADRLLPALLTGLLPVGPVLLVWRTARLAVLLGDEGVVIRNVLRDVHLSWGDVVGVEFDDQGGLYFQLRWGQESCRAFPGAPMGRSYDEESRWTVHTQAVARLDDWRVRHAPAARGTSSPAPPSSAPGTPPTSAA
jgi:hypothetical protein